jgi:hypothetical protein
VGDDIVDIKNKVNILQKENTKLREGLEKIIKINRQEARDRYGDENKSNTWQCVIIAHEALNHNIYDKKVK